jgi:NAD binding domain of 6-phosphogluconate dehydrogenase/Glucose-6-phosphate dehydrogenase, C-terminal domain
MQPDEAIYMKTNVKSPGFASRPIQSELEVNYDTRFFAHQQEVNPDAYTRLILDVLQGKHAAFVRDDELRRAWEIFTPLLDIIEKDNIQPIIYKQGTRGPPESDAFVSEKAGYIRNEDYVFYEGGVARKTEGTDTFPGTQKNPEIIVADENLCDIGVYGQSVMGANLSLNIAEKGFRVVVGNRTHQKVEETLWRARDEGDLPVCGSNSPEHFVAQLKKPRKVIILVQAGKPVDDTILVLSKYLEPGDVVIDGGNEWFPNSIRRGHELEPKGIHFIGMGISGGEEGARNGPSMMPGGPREAYQIVEPILVKCAAQVERMGACVCYLGPLGAVRLPSLLCLLLFVSRLICSVFAGQLC